MMKETKSLHLQIRVSRSQKAAIERAARKAGMPMSDWVMARALPAAASRFQQLARGLAGANYRFALAEMNEFLAGLSGAELLQAVEFAPGVSFSSYLENYLAAMVETAAFKKRVDPPAWLRDIPALDSPVFGSDLASLRLHLLCGSPAPFRRRNIFIDSTVGDRI